MKDEKARKVLVIDVGGTHVKVLATGRPKEVKIASGKSMSGPDMVRAVRKTTRSWSFDVVSIGYPGPVLHGRPVRDPVNLGPGWVGLDFAKAFGKPVRLVNDAAMQALGSYQGGRMLFLGLGTGLGTAMIVDGLIEPMELAHLPYKKGRTYEDFVGERGRERLGNKKWRKEVADVIERLRAALEPDEVVLGGGNEKRVKELPDGVRRGDNRNAFLGGFRMWQTDRLRSKSAEKGRGKP